MSQPTSLFKKLLPLVFLSAVFFADQASATVFSWGVSSYHSDTWAGGAPGRNGSKSNSYNNDSANGSGNDITVTVSQINSNRNTDTWGNGSPGVNTNLNPTGTGSSLYLNVTAEPNSTTYIKVTINFIGYAKGVTGVQFSIFDVDSTPGQFIDLISSIQGVALSGATIGANTVTPVDSPTYSVTGTGIDQAIAGNSGNTDGANNGTVNINFGTQVVTEVSFMWSNQDAGLGNQWIALSNITYTTTPEVHPALAAILACGAVIVSRKLRRLCV